MMKDKFESKLSNSTIMTREEYSAKLQRLIELEHDHSTKKERSDYHLLKKFDVLEVNMEGVRVQKLVKKGTECRFVCKEVIIIKTTYF